MPRRYLLGQMTGTLGIIGIVAATFSPWVTSGSVSRNLYQITGVAAHVGLLGEDSVVVLAEALIGPVCLIPVVLAAVRLRRTAAGAAIVIAVVTAAFATTVLVTASGRHPFGVYLTVTGPALMIAAAVLLAVGGILTA